MSRILITSGPTRQHLDPVRYLTNASTGLMGQALAAAALHQGHEVVLVSGPVGIHYPPEARLIEVVSTEEMLAACQEQFPSCDGLIAAAAPCDYRPQRVEPHKIRKTGGPLILELVETEDIVAALASIRQHQWIVGFALETEDLRLRALAKLERKSCDLIVTNSTQAIGSTQNDVEILDRQGQTVGSAAGSKMDVASRILEVIARRLA